MYCEVDVGDVLCGGCRGCTVVDVGDVLCGGCRGCTVWWM